MTNKRNPIKQWIWWKPLAIFVLFLCVDRLLSIPYLRNRVTDFKSVDLTLAEVEQNSEPKDFDKSRSAKQIWALGTSRTKAFNAFPDPGYTLADPYLNSEDKKKLADWHGKSIAFPGGSFINFYTRFLQLLERGLKPDLVFVEISPGSFNRNSLINIYSKQEGLSIPYALSHLEYFETDTVHRLFVTRTFLSYRYQFSFSKFFDLLKGKEGKAPLLEKAMKDMNIDPKQLNRYNDFNDNISNFKSKNGTYIFEDDINPDPSSAMYAIKYLWMVNELEKTIYNNFEVDYEQLAYLDRMIKLLETHKIPYIFWKPKSHPNLTDVENNPTVTKLYKEIILPKLQSYNVKYLDMQTVDMKCAYYLDAAHVSPRCYTEITKELLNVLK
ncbi:DUF1574 family protein [Leptospira sp. 96542]|nr:DUF1574 family protein [Leptospira sp. 96542]